MHIATASAGSGSVMHGAVSWDFKSNPMSRQILHAQASGEAGGCGGVGGGAAKAAAGAPDGAGGAARRQLSAADTSTGPSAGTALPLSNSTSCAGEPSHSDRHCARIFGAGVGRVRDRRRCFHICTHFRNAQSSCSL